MKKISKIDFLFLGIGMLAIIGAIVIGEPVLPEKSNSSIGVVLSIFLALLGIVYAVYSSRISLKKQMEILEKQSTKRTAQFPQNILDIIQLMDSCKKNNYLLDIFTDVPGYGIFSQNEYWHKYYNKITELEDVPVHWYYYSEEKLQTQREEQFAPWKKKTEEELNPIIKKYKENVYRDKHCRGIRCTLLHGKDGKDKECKNEMKDDKECYVFYNNLQSNYKSIIDCVKKLQDITSESIRHLQKQGAIRKVVRLDSTLPFFAWIALDRVTRSPVEGIISYNVHKENVLEEGFRSNDPQLLKLFYDIIKVNVQTQKSRGVETDAQNES